jgi:hypothetical protein
LVKHHQCARVIKLIPASRGEAQCQSHRVHRARASAMAHFALKSDTSSISTLENERHDMEGRFSNNARANDVIPHQINDRLEIHLVRNGVQCLIRLSAYRIPIPCQGKSNRHALGGERRTCLCQTGSPLNAPLPPSVPHQHPILCVCALSSASEEGQWQRSEWRAARSAFKRASIPTSTLLKSNAECA